MAEKITAKKINIVGGGAAGIFAAIGAAEKGAKVQIFEKNNQLGLKLLITGKGRCNLTNTASIDDFIMQFPDNGRFLYSAFAKFSNLDLIKFLNGLGLATKEERGGRVFPLSDRSKDVVEALKKQLQNMDIKINLNERIQELVAKDGMIVGVKSKTGLYPSDAIVVTTGGLSYPRTGSTGDGYDFAKKTGHTITPLMPSLVPLETNETWVKEASGLSLRNVKVTAWGRKKLGEEFGEMLFTHFGVSGPIILTLSRCIIRELEYYPVRLELNLKPALDRKTLENRLLRDFNKFSGKHLKNALAELLPQKLIIPVLASAGLDPDKLTHQVTRIERRQLLDSLQGLPLTVVRARPICEAIVTSGGVSLTEIDPRTMASKIVPNLYFAGEILDIDGYTGGYNLQAAFSTGYLAGQSAAISLNEEDDN